MKLEIWGIVVRDDRGKNTQTMLDLEISKDYRNKVLKELVVEDYSDGPLQENLHGGSDMWVFGKMVKGSLYKNKYGRFWWKSNMHFFSHCRT